MSFQFSLYDALVGIAVPPEKAKAVIDALERDMDATLATKPDILLLRKDVDALRQDVRHEIDNLRSDVEQLREDVRHQIDNLRSDIEQLRKDVARDLELLRATMTVRLGSIQVVTAGLLFAALKLT
jgi:outer membrane murein-binding lipoprotein Lpp